MNKMEIMLNVNLKNEMNLIEKKINSRRFSSQIPPPKAKCKSN